MTSEIEPIDREQVEQIVRKILFSQIDQFSQQSYSAEPSENPIVVNVSARHVHLCQASLDRLFGPDSSLTVYKTLYNGEFASNQLINLVGIRDRMISKVRVLGPLRPYDQVELTFSEAIHLGINAPLRISGDITCTPGCTLVGPAGSIQLTEGVIRAKRHIHMGPSDLKKYQVRDGDMIKLEIGGKCGLIFDNVVVRYNETFKLEAHIDTDEGNACDLMNAEYLKIITN